MCQSVVQTYPSFVPNPTVIVKTPSVYVPPPVHNWVLKKTENATTSSVLSICEGCNLVSWGDWLFYSDLDNSSIVIHGYNLKTQTAKIIYDLNQHPKDFSAHGGALPSDVSQLTTIGDTLYFSLGGYLRGGAIYWQDLPPSSDPVKLTDSSNGSIVNWKGHTWIVGGEGDACWGVINFSLVDLVAKTVKPIATSTEGCYGGEEFIDIDKRDRMIMAAHTPGSTEPGDTTDTKIFEYVLAVPLDSPSDKEGIIAQQDMPKNISGISYNAVADQLLLKGNQNYVFDFSTNKLSQTDKQVEIPDIIYPFAQTPDLANIIKQLVLPSGFKFELE